jgi:hypothetical protein
VCAVEGGYRPVVDGRDIVSVQAGVRGRGENLVVTAFSEVGELTLRQVRHAVKGIFGVCCWAAT